MTSKLKVAIVGGSIAGCTVAVGLVNYPDISFDVFDGKSTFRERGAGVGIAPNAQKALQSMGLDAEKLLQEAGGMKMNQSICLAATGEYKGQPLMTLPAGVYVVDRLQWLEVLLKKLPEDKLHAEKKLASIEYVKSDGTYTLTFEDGSNFEGYDVVLGCDGAKSKVRQAILGPDHQDKWSAHFGGYWDARGRMTPQEAVKRFGKELFDPTAINDVALVGEGGFLLFGPTDDGKVYHVIASAAAGPKFDRSLWKTQLSREFLEENYKDWDEGFRDGMIDALMAEDSGPGMVFSQWESAEAPTYYREPGLAMLGDAAHSTTPWMGQGACLAIEDAAIISRLLGSVEKKSEVPAALEAFDKARRGRPEHVMKQSQEAAKLLTGQISLNPEDLKPLEADKWWTDVWDIDMDLHLKEAIEHFHSIKTSS